MRRRRGGPRWHKLPRLAFSSSAPRVHLNHFLIITESLSNHHPIAQDFLNKDGFMFSAGFPRTKLVVRVTSTVYNYDYCALATVAGPRNECDDDMQCDAMRCSDMRR